MIKLSKWGAMTPLERSLCVVFTKIEKCGNRAKVPSPVQYTTKYFFRIGFNLEIFLNINHH